MGVATTYTIYTIHTFPWEYNSRRPSPPIALPRKASVANDAADAINHTTLLTDNAAGHTTRALTGIATAAVGAAAVAATARVSHFLYYANIKLRALPSLRTTNPNAVIHKASSTAISRHGTMCST
jgi:hypothetical protein